MLGVGMIYGSLENIPDLIPARHRKKVLGMAAGLTHDDMEYEHRLYVCQKCHKITSRFYIKIDKGPQKQYESVFRCGSCRTKLTPITEKMVRRLSCPDCGDRGLSIEKNILWD